MTDGSLEAEYDRLLLRIGAILAAIDACPPWRCRKFRRLCADLGETSRQLGAIHSKRREAK